ncbi:MAG TPA: hypothetical protein DEB55_01170, partial [Microbacterium sp.]|nr:hypothetical protein [Microbacterium sp.]
MAEDEPASDAALALRGVTKVFGQTRAVDGIDLTVPAGTFYGLVGPNGAGKTTFMSVVGGKHMVDQDAVRVLGRAAFEDTTLSAELALLTGNWTHTVAFAGHNVPYQAMEV